MRRRMCAIRRCILDRWPSLGADVYWDRGNARIEWQWGTGPREASGAEALQEREADVG